MMKTLIELYDDRPFENILATEVFLPETTIFLAMPEIAGDPEAHHKLTDYFAFRQVKTDIRFAGCDMYDPADITRALQQISEEYEDCAIDITGGTDAALFAAGIFCHDNDMPVFTYSRRKDRFFDIINAPFAENHPNTVVYTVSDFLLMAGGHVYKGRVDNRILSQYMDIIDPFFDIFMKHRRKWVSFITYMQLLSQTGPDDPIPLDVTGNISFSKKNKTYYANIDILENLEKCGMISRFSYNASTVSFVFRDHQCRAWLRDVGSVLELYTYKACLDTGYFSDVHTSVVVDWKGKSDVSNEIDVMAVRNVIPYFISCKASDVHTEALNELAILRDRFGGKMAKAVIVTAEKMNVANRHRAFELDIDVIDQQILEEGKIREALISIASDSE